MMEAVYRNQSVDLQSKSVDWFLYIKASVMKELKFRWNASREFISINIFGFLIHNIIFSNVFMKKPTCLNNYQSIWTQDLTWTYIIWCSKGVLDVFSTSSERSIYFLCPGGSILPSTSICYLVINEVSYLICKWLINWFW